MNPFGSVLQKSECETVALNIMKILAKNGDIWRELPIEEYIIMRKKDGNYSISELLYFESVIGYTLTEQTAVLFSDAWKQVYTNKIKSKLVRDKKDVYYLDDTETDFIHLNPLKHAYGINEVYDKMTNFNVYYIMEWDEVCLEGVWVWSSEKKRFPHEAEQRVKELNEEHKQLTDKL